MKTRNVNKALINIISFFQNIKIKIIMIQLISNYLVYCNALALKNIILNFSVSMKNML
jgi:hypothetical protein